MAKFEFSYVQNYFEQEGYKLLEKEYKNAKTSIKYKCKCGNTSQTSFSNFKKSSRCTNCAGCKKYTHEQISAFFKKHGCELLSEYKNKKTKLKFKCKCGNVTDVFWQNFKKEKNHKCCRECWKKTFSGENHYNWNADRDFIKMKQSFHRKCCTMLFNVLKQTKQKKYAKTYETLKYTAEELRLHLMSHQNWENVKNQKWDIDHIFPVSAFVKAGIFNLEIINGLDNLQPMLRIPNLKKAGKYNHEEFKIWLKTKGVNI